MVKVIKNTTRILDYQGFEAFLKTLTAIGYPDVQKIILYSVEYQTIRSKIAKKIIDDFAEAQKFVNLNYEHCRPIHADTNSWNQTAWEKDVLKKK
jgi:hypothetical protein